MKCEESACPVHDLIIYDCCSGGAAARARFHCVYVLQFHNVHNQQNYTVCTGIAHHFILYHFVRVRRAYIGLHGLIFGYLLKYAVIFFFEDVVENVSCTPR